MKNLSFSKVIIFLQPFIKAILIMVVGHFIITFVLKWLRRALSKSKLDELLVNLISKSLNICLHLMVILSALSAVGVSTTGLLAALSAIAAGIALALKDSLSNIAGGIVLLISPRFVSGDYINVGGEEGKVISVDLMHTTILTYNNRQVSIPNGTLVNSQISNLTRSDLRRVDIKVPVPYDSDIAAVKSILIDAIKDYPLTVTDETHPTVAVVDEYADSAIIIFTKAWCKHEHYWQVYYGLMEKFISSLGKEGITIPFNQLDVNIKK